MRTALDVLLAAAVFQGVRILTFRAAGGTRVGTLLASTIRADSFAELGSADVESSTCTSALASHGRSWSTRLAFARRAGLTLVVGGQVVPVYAGCGYTCGKAGRGLWVTTRANTEVHFFECRSRTIVARIRYTVFRPAAFTFAVDGRPTTAANREGESETEPYVTGFAISLIGITDLVQAILHVWKAFSLVNIVATGTGTATTQVIRSRARALRKQALGAGVVGREVFACWASDVLDTNSS